MHDIVELLAQAKARIQAGQLDEGERLCGQVLAVDPHNVDVRLLLASLCDRSSRLDEAIKHLTDVLRWRPDHAAALQLLGIALARQGKLDDAIICLERANAVAPGLENLSDNLCKLKAARECARGRSAASAKRPAEAESCFRQALQHLPDHGDALSGLAAALTEQSRLEEAEAVCRHAVTVMPQVAEVHYNLTIPLLRQNKVAEAIECYRRAIGLKPDQVEFHTRYALALLLAGRFDEGWEEYEWRWRQRGHQEANPSRPTWTGEPFAGRTIVLSSEQGYGDTLHFIRYAEMVKERGGTVVVECQSRLVRLLTGCPGVDVVVARGQPLPDYDLVAPLMNLPRIFQTRADNVPVRIPYLHADAELAARWKEKLAADTAMKVGIAWRGSASHRSDAQRSILLARFAALANIANVRLYSLQVGAGREELTQLPWKDSIRDLADDLADFQDTAGLVQNLDLVITCDSAPAHLAGALGIPVWVALPFAPDWRWLLDRRDTPWYPTMRLFRQSRPGDWDDVFRRIEVALADKATERAKHV